MKKINFALIIVVMFTFIFSAFGEEIISPPLTPDPNITLIEPTPTPIPKKVTIQSSAKPMMKVGEEVRLTCTLVGFEDCTEILYQWQCDKGNGFEDVPGAEQDYYSFPATAESLCWSWRLIVYYR